MLPSEKIKQDYPIRAYARTVLGEPKHVTRKADVYTSPFREDRNPSFHVFDNGFYDYGAPQDSGHSAIDLAMMLYRVDFKGACEIITGVSPVEVKQHQPTPSSKKQSDVNPRLTIEYVSTLTNNVHEASDYLHSERHLSDEVIFRAMIGVRNNKKVYELADGRKVDLLYKQIAIPHVVEGTKGRQVRTIKYRLLDESLYNCLDDIVWGDVPLYNAFAAEIGEQYGIDPLNMDLIYRAVAKEIVGRYTSEWIGSTGMIGIYNANRLAHVVNGKVVSRRLSWVVAVESEFCALALESAGIPAVAIPSKKLPYAKAFENISTVYAAFDNDHGGQERLNLLAADLHHSKINVMEMPEGCKDPTDVIHAGKLDAWLDSYGLSPMKLD